MKKLLLTMAIAILLFSCQNNSMEPTSTEIKPEKIYRIIYHSFSHTSGEVPIDEKLYATGDFARILSHIESETVLKREGYDFVFWNIYSDLYPDGIFAGRYVQVIMGESDINAYAVWQKDKLTDQYESDYLLIP